jgi:hypothetical protein
MVVFPVFAVKIWPVMLGELSLLQAYISAAVLHSSSYSIDENNTIHSVDEAKVRIVQYVWSCRYRIGCRLFAKEPAHWQSPPPASVAFQSTPMRCRETEYEYSHYLTILLFNNMGDNGSS